MSHFTYHTSPPDRWVMPRPYRDANLRKLKYGPVAPMTRPGLIARLLGRA